MKGPVALKNLLTEIDLASVTGRVIFIPVLNVEAFRNRHPTASRPTGSNLIEPSWTGPAKIGPGRITHRMAAFIREFIWPRVHVVIDIHSGGNLIGRFVYHIHPLDDASNPGNARRRPLVRRAAVISTRTNAGLLTSEASGWGRSPSAASSAGARRSNPRG